MFLMSICFIMYQIPKMFHILFTQNGTILVPLLIGFMLFLWFIQGYTEKKQLGIRPRMDLCEKKMKDKKQILLEGMDPLMKKMLKDSLKKDIELERRALTMSDKGCSKKCSLINEYLKEDNKRHQRLLNSVANFQWCENCIKGLQKESIACNKFCGARFYDIITKDLPLFDEKQQTIDKIKLQISEMDEKEAA